MYNDRNYGVEKADNIDKTKINRNLYWSQYSSGWYHENTKEGKPTFEQVEKRFYKKHFKKQYDAQVKRHRERRQLNRIKSFDEWRKARQYCPEELYLQIGNIDETVDGNKFIECAGAYINKMGEWLKSHGSPFTVLDCAIHMDEAVPQLHIRRVWHSINPETGIDEIGQNKALERAGVQLPDPSKPEGKYNNRKMTLDKEMRTIWIDICKSHGLNIEEMPEQGKKHNQTKAEYVDAKQREARKQLQAERKALEAEKKAFEEQKAKDIQRIEEMRKQASDLIADAEFVNETALSALNAIKADNDISRKKFMESHKIGDETIESKYQAFIRARRKIDAGMVNYARQLVSNVKQYTVQTIPEKTKEKEFNDFSL